MQASNVRCVSDDVAAVEGGAIFCEKEKCASLADNESECADVHTRFENGKQQKKKYTHNEWWR